MTSVRREFGSERITALARWNCFQPLLSRVAALDTAPSLNVAEIAESLPPNITSIGKEERRAALDDLVRRVVAQVIGLKTPQSMDATLSLFKMGLDSLMAVELRNVLVRLGGQSLPATLLFDYPHLDALSSHLFRVWGLDFDAMPDVTTAPVKVSSEDDLAALSDEEAESLLLAELANGDDARRRP